MGFELYVASRYLLARRKQAFISVISAFSTLGVAVGVMALVVALALMTGLQGELRDRIVGSTGHLYVWKVGGLSDYRAEVAKLRQVPGVVGAAPAIQGEAVINGKDTNTFIRLKGIDPELEGSVTDVSRSMIEGSLGALAQEPGDGEVLPAILIGRQLAQTLGVGVGDTVTLITSQGTAAPWGVIPRSRPARVVGIFSLGLQEFDAQWGFVSLRFAERLVGVDGPELIQLRVADMWEAPAIGARITGQLGPDYVAQDWQDLNQSLFSALWVEKMVISITIGLIVAVAALQIVASLVLLVMEKSRDIAILKTMGASSARVMRIFMLQGVIIGIVGTAAGGALGLAVCWVLDTYRLIHIPMDVYQVSYVPFVVVPADFAVVVVSAIAICFLATIYPSRQASKLDPVQALRFE